MGFHNSKKVTIDGIVFFSKVEADYYLYLCEQKRLGLIEDFKIQPKYLLIEKFERHGEKHRDINYLGDFLIRGNDGNCHIVDIKGMPTETSLLKRKMFLRKYDIPLKWITRYKGEWVDYFDNVKRRREDKKAKNNLFPMG